MKVKIVALTVIFLFALSFAPDIFAENVEVLGRVENLSPETVRSTIEFKDSASQKVVLIKVIDPSGGYAVSLPQGTYDITVIPPPASGQEEITKRNQKIMSNLESTFILPSSSSSVKQGSQSMTVYAILVSVTLLMGAGFWYFLKKNKR